MLGCTHYPFFKTFLLDEITQQQLSIQVIDSGQAIAERVRQLLIANNLSASLMSEKRENLSQKTSKKNTITRPPLTFHATKYSDRLCALVERLLGTEMALQYYSH